MPANGSDSTPGMPPSRVSEGLDDTVGISSLVAGTKMYCGTPTSQGATGQSGTLAGSMLVRPDMYCEAPTSLETTVISGKLTSSVVDKGVPYSTSTIESVMGIAKPKLQYDVCNASPIGHVQVVASMVAGTVLFTRDKHGLQDKIRMNLPSCPIEAKKPVRSIDARVLSVKRGVHPLMHQHSKGSSGKKKKEGQKITKKSPKKMPKRLRNQYSPK